MDIGIIQGRLSPPIEGFQECPVAWEREFEMLPTLGLTHIEWIITKDKFDTNPFFSEDLQGYPISSACCDFVVAEDFLKNPAVIEKLHMTCMSAVKNGVKGVTIPLLEESSVVERKKRSQFVDMITPFSEKYVDLDFTIEAELGADDLLDIVERYDNFYVTYDTGNMTSFGASHENYIGKVSHKINNVHLKDRTYGATTVPPGFGDTNFKLIFKELKKIGYNGPYTIQTARMAGGKEVETILKHKEYFEELHHE